MDIPPEGTSPEETINHCLHELLSRQRPLDEEFQRVLNEEAFDLYEE